MSGAIPGSIAQFVQQPDSSGYNPVPPEIAIDPTLDALTRLIAQHEAGYRGPKDVDYNTEQALRFGLLKPGLHGPTMNPHTGEWLKAPWHPTAWKEYYYRMFGGDPDKDGVNERDFLSMFVPEEF